MIYITGATGRLGREVAKLFPKAKHVGRESMLDFKDAKIVIHLAGSLEFDDPKKLWESNVEFTRKVVAATPKKARLVFASSIAVFGKKLVEMPANENTLCCPDSAYAETKFEAEKLVLAHGNAVALRIAAVYGPEFDDFFGFLKRIESGKIFIIGNGENRLPFVHVKDVAQVIKNSVKAKTGIYVICGEALQQEKIYAMAAKQLGVAAPKLHVPLWFAKLFVKFGLLKNEHVDFLFHDRVFDCKKAKKTLGFKPRKIEDGIKEMVAVYLEKRKV